MSKHTLIFEVNVEEDSSFIGKVVQAEHEEWEIKDVYAVAFSMLHFTGQMFANLEQLQTFHFPASLMSDLILGMQMFVEKYLGQDGLVTCSCGSEDAEIMPFLKYLQGFTKERMN